MSAPTRICLSLLGGLAICFSLPPWGWWPLAFIGAAAWIAALQGASIRQRAWAGWIVGVCWFGPSTLWMAGLTGAGWPLSVLIGWGGLLAITSIITPGDRRAIVMLPAAVVLFEWVHTHGPFGGVPLSMLAMGQTTTPLIYVARIGGALLLGGVTMLLGGALYLALRRDWKPAIAIVAGVAVIGLAGELWPLGEPVGSVTIAAVQGGGEQGNRFVAGSEAGVFQNHIEATKEIPTDADIDLVVWPENTINVTGEFATHPWRDEVAAESERLGVPIVVGVVEDAGPDEFFNFTVEVNPDGTLEDRYDKERRVPFGEYTPLRFIMEPIAGDLLPPRDQVPGEGVALIETDSGPMAVVISWEVFFARRVREGVRAGGQVVLNPTNGASYWLTQVQTQQMATSQLRALESGRWLVQVAPTGFTAFVSPEGEVNQRTDVSERKIVTQTIERYDSTVPAQALGALPALLAALVAIGFSYGPGLRSRRITTATPARIGSEGADPATPHT